MTSAAVASMLMMSEFRTVTSFQPDLVDARIEDIERSVSTEEPKSQSADIV